MFTTLKTLFTFISGAKIIWKVIANYRILSDSAKTVNTVFNNVKVRGDSTPNQEEAQALLQAASNVLKTGVIDLPGLDEYELTSTIDRAVGAITTSISDSKNSKYHKISLKKVKK